VDQLYQWSTLRKVFDLNAYSNWRLRQKGDNIGSVLVHNIGLVQFFAAWATRVTNVRAVIVLGASHSPWPIVSADGISCINIVYIPSWEATARIVGYGRDTLAPAPPLYLYGHARRRSDCCRCFGEACLGGCRRLPYSHTSPFCGSFAKSAGSWQKYAGIPLRSICLTRIQVIDMSLTLQSHGKGTMPS
jgi:hypothetical protein